MKTVLAAIEAHRKTAAELCAAMLKEYPVGADVRWKKHGIQEGVVVYHRAPGSTRIKVQNIRTGKEVWITAYHIEDAARSEG